jgi:cell division protein FtsB
MIARFSKLKKKKSSPYLLTIFLFLTLGIIFLFWNLNFKIIKKETEVKKQLSALKQQIDEEKSKKEEFLKKIAQAKTYSFLETIAREDFNLKKAGEKVGAFPVIKKEGISTSNKNYFPKKENFWQSFLRKLGIK